MVDEVFFRCSICRFFPEIFAIKVESCQKSRRNLDVFWPSEIFGGLPKVVGALSPLPVARRLEEFREDTPSSPEVIEAHTLNFKPNLKFSRLKFFFGGTPVPAAGVR